jgi:hypothetical protein
LGKRIAVRRRPLLRDGGATLLLNGRSRAVGLPDGVDC